MQQSCQSTQHLLIGLEVLQHWSKSHLYCVARPSWHYNDRSVCVSEHTSLSKFSLQLTWRVLCHSPSLVLALRYTHGQMATMVRLCEVVDTWNCRRTVWVALTINTNGQYCGSELALTINTPRSILRVRTWPEDGAERYVGPESTLHVGRINVSSHWATITRVTRSLR